MREKNPSNPLDLNITGGGKWKAFIGWPVTPGITAANRLISHERAADAPTEETRPASKVQCYVTALGARLSNCSNYFLVCACVCMCVCHHQSETQQAHPEVFGSQGIPVSPVTSVTPVTLVTPVNLVTQVTRVTPVRSRLAVCRGGGLKYQAAKSIPLNIDESSSECF